MQRDHQGRCGGVRRGRQRRRYGQRRPDARAVQDPVRRQHHAGIEEGRVTLIFNSDDHGYTIDNENKVIFEGVYQDQNDPSLYYTYLSAKTIADSEAKDNHHYSIYIMCNELGYVDYLPKQLRVDLTKFVKLYETVENAKDETLDRETLEQLDETLRTLDNVDVNWEANHDSNVDLVGIVTGGLLSDNNGGTDKDTLKSLPT